MPTSVRAGLRGSIATSALAFAKIATKGIFFLSPQTWQKMNSDNVNCLGHCEIGKKEWIKNGIVWIVPFLSEN